MDTDILLIRQWGAATAALFPTRRTAAGFAVLAAGTTVAMLLTTGPQGLIVILVGAIFLTVMLSIPRRVLHLGPDGVSFLATSPVSWPDIAEIVIIESGLRTFQVGVRPSPRHGTDRGSVLSRIQRLTERFVAWPRSRAGQFDPARPLAFAAVGSVGGRTFPGWRPLDPDVFPAWLRAAARSPVTVAARRGAAADVAIRHSYRTVVPFLLFLLVWNGVLGTVFVANVLQDLGTMWPFLISVAIALPLLAVDFIRPAPAVRIEPAGLWIDAEFLPWGDIAAINVVQSRADAEIAVRLRPESDLAAGPYGPYLQAETETGFHLRRTVRHVRVEPTFLMGAIGPYAPIEVVAG